MDPRKVASTAAVVGGVGWLVNAGLVWSDRAGGAPRDVLFYGGLGLLALALAAAGYTLVETAPVWLRGVVSIAFPLLVFMVWLLLDQAIREVYTRDTWLRDELDSIVAGVIAVLAGLWGFTRHGHRPSREEPTEPPAPVHGRRAAR